MTSNDAVPCADIYAAVRLVTLTHKTHLPTAFSVQWAKSPARDPPAASKHLRELCVIFSGYILTYWGKNRHIVSAALENNFARPVAVRRLYGRHVIIGETMPIMMTQTRRHYGIVTSRSSVCCRKCQQPTVGSAAYEKTCRDGHGRAAGKRVPPLDRVLSGKIPHNKTFKSF